RERSEDFLASALQALPQHTESKIWLAGEREDARILRDAAKASGRVKEDLRISGFWRR
ncbi:MAG: SIP domain-containing protein, partial [Rhodobacteraceae bacterium]|nr:SIP domain-containing protein [Paracoccaceae bacterium]